MASFGCLTYLALFLGFPRLHVFQFTSSLLCLWKEATKIDRQPLASRELRCSQLEAFLS